MQDSGSFENMALAELDQARSAPPETSALQLHLVRAQVFASLAQTAAIREVAALLGQQP